MASGKNIRSAAGKKKAAAARASGKVATATSKTSARSTISGPTAKANVAAITDAATAKLVGTQQLAAAFPFNSAKPSEFGAAAAEPAVGQTSCRSGSSGCGLCRRSRGEGERRE